MLKAVFVGANKVRAAPAASSSSASPALFTAVTVNIELRIRKNEGSGSCYISAECMMCMPTTSRISMLLTESREFAITRSELIERLHGFALGGNRCDEVGRSRCNVDQLADEHGVGSRYN